MAKQMKKTHGIFSDYAQNDQANSSQKSIEGAISAINIVAIIVAVTVVLGLVASCIFTAEQMYIMRPLLASGAVFSIFSYVLWFRVRANIFGEIGFIYMALALAYTILPGITFLPMGFNFQYGFDGQNFYVASPQPEELGMHFWRHVLFIAGVATGYLAVRGGALPLKPSNKNSTCRNGGIIAILIAIVGCCIFAVTLLSAPVTSYIEHYTRFDNLSWPLLHFVYLCLIFKSGGYFVLMALLFSQYRRYRILIFILVPTLCAYESIYSLGSRIETLTILLAFIGFYHYKVTPISMKKGIVYLSLLAVLFSGIEFARSYDYSLENVQYAATNEGIKQASEFGAVYNTSFHLYAERAQGNLPPRDWQMFFYEFISLIPFLDHTTYHPQYWYARNYFPIEVVPPQTMGVLADSAIWGGEFDLLIRSLLNGAIFALLTRWFLRRRDKWWALTIYIYCYATCIMTLKYSVLYQLTPLIRIIVPTLLLTGILFSLQRTIHRFKASLIKSVT